MFAILEAEAGYVTSVDIISRYPGSSRIDKGTPVMLQMVVTDDKDVFDRVITEDGRWAPIDTSYISETICKVP